MKSINDTSMLAHAIAKHEEEIKKRISEMVLHGFKGARFVISLGGANDMVFEKGDIVDAIFKVGKIKIR